MKISGNFPLTHSEGGGNYWINGTKMWHPSHTRGPKVTGAEMYADIGHIIDSAIISSRTNYRTGNTSNDFYGPYKCVFSGKPPPPLPDRVIQTRSLRVSNSPFKAKVRRGSIVVSPFASVGIDARYIYGYTVLNQSGLVNHTRADEKCGLFDIEYVSWDRPYIRVGAYDYAKNSHTITSAVRTIETNVSPYDVGWNDDALYTLGDLFPKGAGELDWLVCKTTADANTRLLDLSTALAEAPQAFKSAASGVLTVLRMLKEAKAKEFRLYDKLKRLNGEDNTSKSTREHAKAIKDLSDAIASVWLNFRYSIMPTVLTIEDAVRVAENGSNVFFRTRDGTEHQIDFPSTLNGFDRTSPDVSFTARVCIKRKLSAGASYSSLISTNLAATFWETVPLSFIIDWVLNVGEVIRNLSTPRIDFAEGATFSWKGDSHLTYVHKPSNAAVTIHIRGYDRSVINTSDYGLLKFRPDMNAYRWLDAFALSFRALTKR